MGRVVTVFIQTPVVSRVLNTGNSFFISLGSPLVALEMGIFELTKDCSVSEKMELK